MDVIRKVKCVVVNDQEFQVEGFGRRTGDGLFQSACKIVSIAGDVTETNRLTFQIFTKDPDLAAEVALLCGADAVAKGALACQ